MQGQIDRVCQEPEGKQHQLKNVFFCEQCAEGGISLNLVIFCYKCFAAKMRKHKNHNYYQCSSQKFQKKLKVFKDEMKYNKGITDLKKKNKNIHLLVNENKSIEELIHNHSFKKFLYKCAFWKYDNSDLKEEHIQKARSIILGSDEIEPSKNNKDIEYEIKLDWQSFDEGLKNSEQSVEKAINDEMAVIEEHQQILDIYVEAFSFFQKERCGQVLHSIETSPYRDKYEKIFNMLKLRIYYNQADNDKIKQTLKAIEKIDNSFKSSPINHYYRAQTHWRKVSNLTMKEINKENKLYFCDSQSGDYFYLDNPQEYVEEITKATISKNNNPIFHSGRGIGNLCLQKYTQAIKDFQTALRHLNHSSLHTNLNYARMKKSPEEGLDFMNEIYEKQRGFIVSAIKYYKSKKIHQNIIKCCELLIHCEPQNLMAKVQLIKSHFRTGNLEKIQQTERYLEGIGQQNPQLQQSLKRNELYGKGRANNESGRYSTAATHYRQIIKQKESPTALYNLAISLFNSGKWEKSFKQIEKALQLKNSKKYRKLKFVLCMCMRNFDGAKELVSEFREQYKEIDELLKEKV